MSKKSGGSRPRKREPAAGPASADDAQQPPSTAVPPFKPRPRLFYGLLTLFALWVGVLLGLYFFTVYPTHHHAHGTPAAATEEPTPATIAR